MIIIIITCIYITPNLLALSALHAFFTLQTCLLFKVPSPLRSHAHIHTHTQTRPHTFTLIITHTCTHTYTEKIGTFLNIPWSMQCNAAILQALALINRCNNLSLSLARYPFYTWVGWDNSGNVPFPSANKVMKASLEPGPFTPKRCALSTRPLRHT